MAIHGPVTFGSSSYMSLEMRVWLHDDGCGHMYIT